MEVEADFAVGDVDAKKFVIGLAASWPRVNRLLLLQQLYLFRLSYLLMLQVDT